MAELQRQLVCIVCPNGCRLTVTGSLDQPVITGNRCPKGLKFAQDELTHPVRGLTTTVRLTGAGLPVLPVRTDGEIPKEKIPEAMRQLNRLVVTAPVQCGQTVLDSVAQTGVRVIATCTVKEGKVIK